MIENPDPRQRHYGEFYRLDPFPAGPAPLVTVIGNCQAESLRILLNSTGALRSFRIPPVHEWDRTDLPLLRRVLDKTDVLITQPVRDDYRDLPIGTRQLMASLPAGARTLCYPVLRYDGLMPYQAIIRSPLNPSLNPPVVPYHDLRILAAANRGREEPVTVHPDPTVLQTLAEMSVTELSRREARHGAIPMSDHLAGAPVWHTINHPDNATLAELAQRVISRLQEECLLDPGGEVRPTPPADRELLGGLQAPVDAAAAQALGVPAAATGRNRWLPELAEAHLVAEQLAFYRAHPEIVSAGMARHAEKLALLELSAG